MYNINFEVKYKIIEEELMTKIDAGEDEYSKEDVQLICDELYRHELLSVFYVEKYDDSIHTSIIELWNKIKENPKFLRIFNIYKKKTNLTDNEYIFIEMFNYHLFYAIHLLIKDFLENNNTNIYLLLENIIDKL